MALTDAVLAIQAPVATGYSTWQLDASENENGPWHAVNAGTSSTPFRARFDASDNYWRLLVVRNGAAEQAGTGRVPR